MYMLNGKQYKIHVVTQDDIAQNDVLDHSDLGEKYILVNGCFYFI